MKKVFFWGGKAKAKIIQKMILNEGSKDVEITIIYDPLLKELPFDSQSRFISSPDELKSALADLTHFVMCNGGGHGYARYKIAKELKKLGLKPVEVISPFAILDDIKHKGEGLQVMPGAVVHKFSSIGDQCVINTNATVDHDCVIGNGVHIMGGASIAGQVEIDNFSTIGTNATVLPNIKIGKCSYIGAGAVVNKNVNDYEVVVGVPAKKIKKHEVKVDLSLFEL
jgi:sugar O-acyltransferase (sialic acid O-acetyltransferase NeuD family)